MGWFPDQTANDNVGHFELKKKRIKNKELRLSVLKVILLRTSDDQLRANDKLFTGSPKYQIEIEKKRTG